MTIKECVKQLNHDFVHQFFGMKLIEICKRPNEKEPATVEQLENATKRFANLFDQIIKTKDVAPKKNSKIIVRRVYDVFDFKSIGTYGFDAVLLEDETEYSFMMADWEDVLCLDFDEKSILQYGLEECLFAVLYELTYFGFDQKIAKRRADELQEELEEIVQEIDTEEKAAGIGFDELRAELGLPEETEEEKAASAQFIVSNIEFHRSYYQLIGLGVDCDK